MITDEDKKYLEMLDKEEPKALCLRAKISALFAKDGKVLIQHNNDWHFEYNCSKIGCIRNEMKIPSGHQREICYGVCAEQWCIALAAEQGLSLKGSTLYVTKHPCRICASMASIAGITRVVYQEGYPDVMQGFDIFKSKGIIVEQGPSTEYKDPETSKSHSI
ncbi:MAG: deaminase [Candidatus Gracilibacteria bacterium]